MKNHVYILIVDDTLDEKFREIQRSFCSGEHIVSTNISEGKMIVTTESPGQNKGRSKNLLLDDLKAGY